MWNEPEMQRSEVDQCWDGQMSKLDQCRQTKLFFPKIDKSRSHKIMLQPRHLWGRLVQFITGHCYLNRHEFLCYGIEDEAFDPMCHLCDYNYLQTPAHLISECPYFLGLRTEIFKEFILDPPFLVPINKVLRFLLKSGLDTLGGETEVVHNTTS